MAGILDPTQLGASASEPASTGRGKLEEPDHSSTNWYFTRDEIEKNSPSRKDGVDLKRETYFLKSYCTFLQDLGMRLKLPQVTIATAIVFCHRFFHYQSHARNDRYTIATSCMFLAGKVEETPTPLKDVIITSYEIRNKKDPKAVQKIRQKEVYEQQKELTLFGERVLLATLGFDLNVHHPYTPLVSAIKKFKVAQNALAQVAWNFVNDGLRTSLCLQFKPHHIAAGAIFLAAKFLKVKLPSEGDVVWWQEFDVTPLQLEEISNQMLELYEQNKVILPARGSEIGGSSGVNNQNLGNSQSRTEAATTIGQSQVLNQGFSYLQSAGPVAINTGVSNGAHAGYLSGSHSQQNETSVPTNIEDTYATDEKVHYSQPSRSTANLSDGNASSTSMGNVKEEILGSGMAIEEGKADQMDDEMRLKLIDEDIKGKRPYIGLDEVNKDKVKAALEKRRKSRGEGVDPQPTKAKFDIVDEDDLIERELESGIEAAAKADKAKRERKEKVKLLYKEEQESLDTLKDQEENDRRRKRKKSDLDNFLEKRPISCIQDIVEKDQGRDTADFPSDCTEEGELLNMQDQMHSPRFIDDQLPLSKQHENRQSPVKRHDVGTQDQLGQRDGSHDNKYLHGNHHYYHSSHSQLHRGDTERERNHYKDREKQEWDYKKNRHDHAK